jgi:hypothetical protein
VHDDPRAAPRQHPVRQVAGPLARPPAEQDDVRGQAAPQRLVEGTLVVADDPQRDRLAPSSRRRRRASSRWRRRPRPAGGSLPAPATRRPSRGSPRAAGARPRPRPGRWRPAPRSRAPTAASPCGAPAPAGHVGPGEADPRARGQGAVDVERALSDRRDLDHGHGVGPAGTSATATAPWTGQCSMPEPSSPARDRRKAVSAYGSHSGTPSSAIVSAARCSDSRPTKDRGGRPVSCHSTAADPATPSATTDGRQSRPAGALSSSASPVMPSWASPGHGACGNSPTQTYAPATKKVNSAPSWPPAAPPTRRSGRPSRAG